MKVDREGGTLEGSDAGEWGGSLYWKPTIGAPALLSHKNVRGIEPAGSGAVVAFGLAHLMIDEGSIGWARPSFRGAWQLTEVLELPAAATTLAMLVADKLFAVWADNRAFVFTTQGLLGEADRRIQ